MVLFSECATMGKWSSLDRRSAVEEMVARKATRGH
jgi:hypothetical protein